MAKFDNTNNLSTPNSRSKAQKSSRGTNTHVVGVRIDTKSKNTQKKVYYYKTTGEYKRGEVIRVRVPSGGTPKATIAVENSTKKQKYRIKDLKETR